MKVNDIVKVINPNLTGIKAGFQGHIQEIRQHGSHTYALLLMRIGAMEVKLTDLELVVSINY